MLNENQLQDLRNLNYALLNAQQSQAATLRAAVEGEHHIVTPQDTIRGLYTIVADMARVADLNINTDGEEGCPPCNTIIEELACVGCPFVHLEAKR